MSALPPKADIAKHCWDVCFANWIKAHLKYEQEFIFDVVADAIGEERVNTHKRQDEAVAGLEQRIIRLEDAIAGLTARLDAFEENGNGNRLKVVSNERRA
jgi:ubiquinone biosynthesis protein UbiJ